MRLINTKSFKLEEFSDGSIPPYAILSHTWGNDSEELSLDDVERGRIYKIAAVQAEPAVGSIKFRGCCRQAVEDGLGYVWIDTCCIDKANLVELSEAINSMFRWYSRATVCYAYLSDVPDDDDPLKPESNFQSSRWFQRGWTLQELLAPKNLRFYNSVWRCIGTKGIMSKLITSITHVPRHFLLGVAELRVASVAQRMSWAAQRRTKRLEDLAYCLLGIFGISMPMLYGEGEQAFFRLQEQIMKTTRDDSILAWGLDDESNESCLRNEDGGVLAPSPSHFANSGQIITREHTDNPLHSLDMSGGSLRIYMPLLTTGSGETFGLLNCGPASKPHKIVAIPLTKATSVASNEYVRPRQHPSVLRTVVVSGSPPELIHIKKDSRQNTFKKTYWLYEDDLFAHFNLTLVDVEPQPCWDKQTNLISPIASDQATTDPILLRLRYIKAECRDFVTVLEVPQAESNAEPQLNAVICRTVTCSRNTPLQEIAQNLQKFPSKELGGGSAESGVLHLRVKLKLIEGGIISINPEAVVLQSGDDTMLTSEDADLILDIRQLLRERKEIYTKNKELKAGSESYGIRLRLAEKGLEEVVRQIKELEERRRKLVKEEESSAREMNDLEHEKTTAEERQDYLSTRLPIVHEQLDNLSDGRRRQVCDALFSRALRNGDAEMMELLSDKVRERDGWIPLIAASIRGDVETVQQILSEGEIEPDSKDSVFGRTALSWASANGHTAIVEALLMGL
ncbi:uncharacterized protein Triagg1_3969 [Trichoderma aggressivum f. europaeum]|uniref:Heterokaryon incompatibility domain-containing protein n=1 Tax=Trichoderma aggressivum f. europaeum TaxID=173218 RepID=A0AAE1J8L9_9HYPO|nr:hypothetical protein Triagg1_3969 [Trichoderma aggressivum f. europaeum]